MTDRTHNIFGKPLPAPGPDAPKPIEPRTVCPGRWSKPPKPDPKPKTAYDRYLLDRLEKVEARLDSLEGDVGYIETHLGW